MDAVSRVVEQEEAIPLISMGLSTDNHQRPGKDNADFEIIAYQPGMPYIAISHVWAHGLGNPKDNKIPLCQFRRLAGLVASALQVPYIREGEEAENFYPRHAFPEYDRVNFWVDTMCVPLRPEGLRKLAITKMAGVYIEAYSVMVIDASLSSVQSGDAFAISQITCSVWLRRLWTLQEALLARDLIVVYADKLVSLRHLVVDAEDIKKESFDPDKTIMENYLAFVAVDPMMPFLLSYTARWLYRRSSLDNFKKDWTTDLFDDAFFLTLAEGIRFRTTSKVEDEGVCVAILLGLNVRRVLNTPVKDRMKTVLLLKQRLHRAMVFWDGPKLLDDGFRWAPKTLLGASSKQNIGLLYGDNGSDLTRGNVTEKGFEVQFPGFLIRQVDGPVASTFTLQDMTAGTSYLFQTDINNSETSEQCLREVPGPYAVVLAPDFSTEWREVNTDIAVLIGRCDWSSRAGMSDVESTDGASQDLAELHAWSNTNFNSAWLRKSEGVRKEQMISGEYICKFSYREVVGNADGTHPQLRADRVPAAQYWCVS